MAVKAAPPEAGGRKPDARGFEEPSFQPPASSFQLQASSGGAFPEKMSPRHTLYMSRTRLGGLARCVLVAVLLSATALHAQHAHPEQLGRVHFPTSRAPQTAEASD